MWHRYLKESQGIDSIVSDRGFITYQFFNGVCIIHDLYVLPEYRGTKEAGRLGDRVKELAALRGCPAIGAEVYIARPGFKQNMKLLRHWKMKETDRNEYRVIMTRMLEKDEAYDQIAINGRG